MIFTRVPRPFPNEERTVVSTNDVGKTRYLHCKRMKLGDLFKMAEEKVVRSLPLARAPESQLTAEQSLTGRHWNSPKKTPHMQRQRRGHNEMVGGEESQ